MANKPLNRELLGAVLLWAILWAVLTAFMPALPIDETRYLTVAWEMWHSGDYLLPTLNWGPYSQKPPLLFWLINAVWGVTGLSAGAARVVPFGASLLVVFLTVLLAHRMFLHGEAKQAPATVPAMAGLVLMAMASFMVYGALIMFDVLQTVFVLLAMLAAWQAYTVKRFRAWWLFGLALGLGALAKGPVILVHTLPAVLLFPLVMGAAWNGPPRRSWYGGVALGVLAGVAVGLAWAIPAAIHGGPKFTEMIFWGQSAGRIVHSFAHRQPFWFFAPVLLAFLLPLLFWGPFWGALRCIVQTARTRRDPAVLFLLCWAIPTFLIFSAISGKQPHYLLPMLPALAILIARFTAQETAGKFHLKNLTCLFPALAGLAFLALAPHLFPAHGKTGSSNILLGFQALSEPVIIGRFLAAAILGGALVLGGAKGSRREGQLLGMILCLAILLGTGIAQASQKTFTFYDLRPLAHAIQPYKTHPIAFAPDYAGEIGFLARLTKPVTIVESQPNLLKWLKAHKNGIAVLRTREKDGGMHKHFTPLFSMPYRGSGTISIVRLK